MWFQLKIERCLSEEVESLSEELEEFGALSIMLTDKNDDPILEPEPGTTPLWPEVVIQALFTESHEAQFIKTVWGLSKPHLICHIEVLAEKNWEDGYKNDFQPKQFGTRLWICPTWHTPPQPEAINLMLDPGLAFGTGSHPTTSLCLTWLEQADFVNKTLIDYGCGSGILSLAALKLGATTVYAVDIDAQALQATATNAQCNALDSSQLYVGTPESLQRSVNYIIANILLTPLISLKERFHQLLLPNAHLVVSGLLATQVEELIKAYDSFFIPVTINHSDDWALIVFSRV